MLAFAACHMVTTTIFFYSRLALGALFGIGRDPVGGLRVILAFL